MNNPILSSQFDEAVTWFGSQLESFVADHRDEKGKALYTLTQLLDPENDKKKRNKNARKGTGSLSMTQGARVRRRTKEEIEERKRKKGLI